MTDATVWRQGRLEFEAGELVAAHPPRLQHPHKRLVWALACPPGCVHRGTVAVSRWRAMPLPPVLSGGTGGTALDIRTGVYDYDSGAGDTVEWHVNFADPHLFTAYGGPLFAQDELQVAEHPALACLREALTGSSVPPLTEEAGAPTPVLVMGVERRCAIATGPDPLAGRPRGLYGNAFAAAPVDAVRRAVRVLDPPTVSNIIAMAAPSGGTGRYTPAEIGQVLLTAYTAFSGARIESGSRRTVVHSGFWGCGAFGGNRVLMIALQTVAAVAAGLDGLVLHTVDPAGAGPVSRALRLVAGELLPAGARVTAAELVDRVASLHLRWGVSDGN